MVGAIAWTVLWVVLIALAALALLVALPVRLFVHAQTGKPSQFVARVGLLGGAVPAITLTGHDRKDASDQEAEKSREKGQEESGKTEKACGGCFARAASQGMAAGASTAPVRPIS